jgi:hypothetical protein
VFGFAGGNSVILTGPVPFNLNAALIGRLDYPTISTSNANLIITGNIASGGTVTVVISNLGDAAEQIIGMTNLRTALFTATNINVGMDDISVTATVPEPGSVFLLGAAFLSIIKLTRRDAMPRRPTERSGE